MSADRIEELINNEFGLNSSYVVDLYRQFSRNPQSVDDDWRSFFEDLSGDGAGADETGPENGAAVQFAPVQSARAETPKAAAVDRESADSRSSNEAAPTAAA